MLLVIRFVRNLICAPFQHMDFHHHCIDGLTNKPYVCICVLWSTVNLPNCFSCGCFLRHVRHPQMYSLCSVVSAAAGSQIIAMYRTGCKVSHDLIYTDLTTFWAISSTSGSIIEGRVFSPPLCDSLHPDQPP